MSDSEEQTTGGSQEGQGPAQKNINLTIDAVMRLIVDNPSDEAQTDPVIEKLKELWRDGDTVGTLLNRYRQTA